MRKSLAALTAATTIAVAAVATPNSWWGPALGGFALGALIGSAFARPYYAYPSYGYGYGYPATAMRRPIATATHRLTATTATHRLTVTRRPTTHGDLITATTHGINGCWPGGRGAAT
jgi:hypothetical protein